MIRDMQIKCTRRHYFTVSKQKDRQRGVLASGVGTFRYCWWDVKRCKFCRTHPPIVFKKLNSMLS
jgi:hypothetical protein